MTESAAGGSERVWMCVDVCRGLLSRDHVAVS
jgi:hypothetical protein